jgi:hypothetical protein
VKGRPALAVAVAVAGLLAVGVAVLVASGGEEREPAPELRALSVDHCREFADDNARACYVREFQAMVDGLENPRPAVERITDAARSEGGFLLENCHVVMHTVGRTYARDARVTLGSLMNYLPADNDPGCPAGFAHGLVTGVAGDIDVGEPREAASVCDGAGTRFQRYSCIHGFGHAFMRLYDDQLEPALKLCTALGAQAPDCAQGAYHDYWFAVVGPTRHRCRASRSRTRTACAPTSRGCTCVRAGTGRFSRTGPPASGWSGRRTSWTCARGWAGCNARRA